MKFIDLVKNSINTICAKYLNEKEEIEYLKTKLNEMEVIYDKNR